ncbi:MAG: polymerase subunit delta [Gemmatimonadetes bacterium]|jgi:DNA polymerase-3 subunit delta|nr:polymerase subunit delta [Gemmatimonadota bacterium]
MPALLERAFRKSLQRGEFERVYYFHGDDDFLKEQSVRELVAAAVDPSTRDFNLDIRAAAELDAETLGSLVGTPPMMAERRVVVVRDVAALRKDARVALDRYLKEPAPDVMLILVAPAGEKAKVDKTLEARAATVEFAPLTGDRVPRWITHHVETVLGATITPEAAELLQQATGNELGALAAELDKLASYAGGGTIDEAAVGDVVGVRRGETLGDFLDRIAARDAAGALALLPHILAQPKTSAVSIVMALTTQMLAIGWGITRSRADYFELLKSGKAFPMRPWGEAARAWSAAERHWDDAAIDASLDALLAADIALKETRLSSDTQLLTNLVLALCGARRSTDAARLLLSAVPA